MIGIVDQYPSRGKHILAAKREKVGKALDNYISASQHMS